MPRSCCVSGCKTNFASTVKKYGTKSTFSFPYKSEVRKAWIHACSREPGWEPSKYSAICSDHFTSSQVFLYEGWNKNRITKLKKGAIPHINVKATQLNNSNGRGHTTYRTVKIEHVKKLPIVKNCYKAKNQKIETIPAAECKSTQFEPLPALQNVTLNDINLRKENFNTELLNNNSQLIKKEVSSENFNENKHNQLETGNLQSKQPVVMQPLPPTLLQKYFASICSTIESFPPQDQTEVQMLLNKIINHKILQLSVLNNPNVEVFYMDEDDNITEENTFF